MFDKEIKFICDFCLNKINKAGSFLTFEKLKGIEIHPAILKYISAEIDYQVYQDRKVLLQKSSFDYSGAEISKYFKMIAHEIKKSKRINENEINDLIKKAVTFNFDYTTKPNETLTEFIFQDSETKSPEDIMMLLDYPYYYGYLRQILFSYFEKKQLLTVDKKDFEFLLNKIDSELFPAKPNELVDNALNAIADFFNIGAVLRTQIPPQAAELYLNQVKLNEHLERFQNAVNQSPKTKYEIDEIKKILYSHAETVEKKSETPKYEMPPVPEESVFNNQNTEVSDNLAAAAKTEVYDNLVTNENEQTETSKIELDDLELINPGSKDTVDLSEEITIEEEVETIPINTDELEETANYKLLDSSLPEIKRDKEMLSFLTDREVQRVISSIFNEDEEDFATTIETISECKSYEKATEILKTLYTTYNVNPYSRDAILLTNAVAKYFTVA